MTPVRGDDSWAARVYRALLCLYPRPFRDRFGAEMLELFDARRRAAAAHGPDALVRFWFRVAADAAAGILSSRRHRTSTSDSPGRFDFRSALLDAWRTLSRSPGLSAAIGGLMALTVGAATAIFSVASATLLRPLPFGHPDRIVALWERRADPPAARNVVGGHEFPLWHDRNHSFSSVAAMTYDGSQVTLTGVGEPRALSGIRVTHEFFDVMDVQPIIGRAFRADEDTPGRGGVVVVSHTLWTDVLGANPSIVGRVVTLDGKPFTVVGVMDGSFTFPAAPDGRGPDFWMPITEPLQHYRGRHFLDVVARLAPGMTVARAQADMNGVAAGIARELPDLNRGHDVLVVPLQGDLVRDARPVLLLLLAAVGCLLAIGCSNVASLLVARGLARGHEMSVRLALGASRTRLMGQLLLEGTALAGLGAIAGVGVARGLLALVPVLVPRELLGPPDVSLDAHALAFAAAIAGVTGLVFGLVPALQLRRVDLADALKTRTRSATTGRRGVRSALVTTEIAFTLLLLSCASLVGRGLVALSRVDPGFAVDDVRVVSLTLPPDRYATAVSRRAFASDVVTRLAAVPGVESAAVTNAVPLGGALSTIAVDVERRPIARGQDWTAAYRVVGAGYFKTLGIRLVEGRAFTPGDARIAVPLIRWFPQQPVPANIGVPQPIPVAIVNEAMAQRFWPEQDAIGRRFRLLFSPWITVVGVAANTRDASLGDAAGPELYLHDLQEPQADLDVLVRDARDGGPAIIDLEQAIRRLDRGVAIRSVRTMTDLADRTFAVPRFTTVVVGAFAVLALLLMIAGVYGLAAFSAIERVPEMGIRLALGASRGSVVGLIVRHMVVLGLIGSATGLAAVMPIRGLMASRVLGVGALDPLTSGVVMAAVIGIVAIASAIPARRASAVDPATVLRRE